MGGENETAEEPAIGLAETGRGRPGVAIVWTSGGPKHDVRAVGEKVVFGRSPDVECSFADEKSLSSEHAEITWLRGGYVVRDLGSRNGTFVNGERISGMKSVEAPAVLRTGQVVALLLADIGRRRPIRVLDDGYVVGDAMQSIFHDMAVAAREGWSVLIQGESGAGKMRVARTFHENGPRAKGPFIHVDCGTLSETLAEGQLFGAVRGGYSGALGHPGHIERAQGGTLFLDEIGNLSLELQAKLLVALETKRILPIGAKSERRIDFGYCCATNVPLANAVRERRFRHDLYFRIAEEEVLLPPLRERREEIPYLLHIFRAKLQNAPPMASELVEACLLRAWSTGNARELEKAVRDACKNARESDMVGAVHLPPSLSEPLPAIETEEQERDRVLAKLRELNGDKAATARALKMGRTTLYEKLERWGVKKT